MYIVGADQLDIVFFCILDKFLVDRFLQFIGLRDWRVAQYLYGVKSWYLYGASDNVYREFMPNYYIQWQAFTEAKAAGYELYDFFGISGKTDESDPLYGLYF